MNIALKKFNMNQISDDSVVVLIGKRRTGKSILVKDFFGDYLTTSDYVVNHTNRFSSGRSNISKQ